MASHQNSDEISKEVLASYIKAYNNYKDNDTDKTKEYNNKIIEYYKKNNDYNEMINYREDLINCLENDFEFDDAIIYCEECIELSELINDIVLANSYRLRAANHYARGAKYDIAAKHFEKLAIDNQTNEYNMNAILCYLKSNVMIAKEMLNTVRNKQPEFSVSNDYKFLSQVIEAIINLNMDIFMKAVTTYDNIKKLEPWQVTLLLHIKKIIM